MRLPLALAATLSSSALFALAFPPLGLRPLAFVCLVPLLLALRSGSAARALGLAWLWAVASAWAIAPFFASSLAAYYQRPVWVGLLAGMAIFSVTASLYYMVFALIDRWLPRDSLAAPLLVAAAWTSVELARGRLFHSIQFLIGNPWGLLGYTHASGSLAQVASFAGVYGIGFAIAAVNAGLAGWMAAWLDPAKSVGRAARAGLLAALPAAIFALGGGLALRAARADGPEELIEVGVVQADVPLGRVWLSEYFGKNLDLYIDLTGRLLRDHFPRVIVWPESAITFFLESEPLYREAIAKVLAAGDVELLAGGPARDEEDHAAVFNSVFTISAHGDITARYDKEILLPFSEYYPFRSLGLMRRRVDGARTYSPGPPHPAPLDTRMGRAGVLVCNEAMLPEVAGERVRAGAEILLSPSNDSWIAGKGFADHMLAVVGLRAIEQRRYLVRASTSGPSAVIDPWGRTAVRTPVSRPAVLLGGVRPQQELTLYARVGDAFGAGCGLVVLIAIAFRLGSRQSRSPK